VPGANHCHPTSGAKPKEKGVGGEVRRCGGKRERDMLPIMLD